MMRFGAAAFEKTCRETTRGDRSWLARDQVYLPLEDADERGCMVIAKDKPGSLGGDGGYNPFTCELLLASEDLISSSTSAN